AFPFISVGVGLALVEHCHSVEEIDHAIERLEGAPLRFGHGCTPDGPMAGPGRSTGPGPAIALSRAARQRLDYPHLSVPDEFFLDNLNLSRRCQTPDSSSLGSMASRAWARVAASRFLRRSKPSPRPASAKERTQIFGMRIVLCSPRLSLAPLLFGFGT